MNRASGAQAKRAGTRRCLLTMGCARRVANTANKSVRRTGQSRAAARPVQERRMGMCRIVRARDAAAAVRGLGNGVSTRRGLREAAAEAWEDNVDGKDVWEVTDPDKDVDEVCSWTSGMGGMMRALCCV